MRTSDIAGKSLSGAEHQIELLKAELLTTVSHELRGPLASIQGYAATLLRYQQRLSPEERSAFLMAISEASTRLEHIVEQLLEMSQLETQTQLVTVVPINLAYLIREAITSAEQHGESEPILRCVPLPQRPVASTFHIEPQAQILADQNLTVQGDRRWLRTMLDALLENAAHYSLSQGQVEIGMRLHRTRHTLIDLLPRHLQLFSSPLPLVEIWVKDQGRGIPTEHLPYIFDRFYRIDTGLTREVNGLGLGLSMCKRIVELHNGVIWGESDPGKGSTFHVLLPEASEAVSPQTERPYQRGGIVP